MTNTLTKIIATESIRPVRTLLVTSFASGANVKVVQARLRHASASTTLNTYAHLWPDSDEATRTAVEAVLVARADSLRTQEVVV
jgi:integrase